MDGRKKREAVAGDEVLNAAILLRELEPNFEERVAAGVIGRVRKRRRRNLAFVSVLVVLLAGGAGGATYWNAGRTDMSAAEDPYLSLYDSLYGQTAAYPELEGE